MVKLRGFIIFISKEVGRREFATMVMCFFFICKSNKYASKQLFIVYGFVDLVRVMFDVNLSDGIICGE